MNNSRKYYVTLTKAVLVALVALVIFVTQSPGSKHSAAATPKLDVQALSLVR